jgi:hypothetical protein
MADLLNAEDLDGVAKDIREKDPHPKPRKKDNSSERPAGASPNVI